MTRRFLRSSGGMTLIEIMIAILIFSSIALVVFGSFTQTFRTKQRIERDVDFYHVVRMSMQRMTRELSMAYVSSVSAKDLTNRPVQTAFIGDDRSRGDRVDFTSFSHHRLYRDAHESDQNELSFFVAPCPEETSLRCLVRREQNRIDNDPQRGGRSQVMVEGVKSFDLEYLDPTSGEWLSTWDTTQSLGQSNRLPAQVKIQLEVIDPRDDSKTQVFTTRASINLVWALNHATYKI